MSPMSLSFEMVCSAARYPRMKLQRKGVYCIQELRVMALGRGRSTGANNVIQSVTLWLFPSAFLFIREILCM